MKLTAHEVILIVLIIVVVALGVDHLILRQRISWQKWQFEATGIINQHDQSISQLLKAYKVSPLPLLPEEKSSPAKLGK